MSYQKYLYSLIINLLLIFQSSKADNFIFDLGGVLIDTNPVASLQYIGLKNISLCMFYLKKGPLAINNHLKSTFFKILSLTSELHTDPTLLPKECTYDEHGNILPYYMYAWLTGALNGEQIKEFTITAMENHPEWFVHESEKRAISNLVTMVFTPEQFIATRKLYHEGIRFIKACKKQGHNVYILSNWDAQSFTLLKTEYAQLFDLVDGIVISGETNSAKPSLHIYTTLLNRYNLNPKKCWFIDDQPENIAAAKQVGIQAILCEHTWPLKKPKFQQIAQLIRKINTDHKSVKRREKRINKGANPNNTKNTNNPIIDGEKIS